MNPEPLIFACRGAPAQLLTTCIYLEDQGYLPLASSMSLGRSKPPLLRITRPSVSADSSRPRGALTTIDPARADDALRKAKGGTSPAVNPRGRRLGLLDLGDRPFVQLRSALEGRLRTLLRVRLRRGRSMAEGVVGRKVESTIPSGEEKSCFIGGRRRIEPNLKAQIR